MATKEATSTAIMHPKRLILGIYAPYNHASSMDFYFQEFLSLLATADIVYEESLFFKIRQTDNNSFLTKGKMQELTAFCDEHEIEEIVISEFVIYPITCYFSYIYTGIHISIHKRNIFVF